MSDNGANKSGPSQVAHCLRADLNHAGMLSESFLRLPDNLRFESSRRCLSPGFRSYFRRYAGIHANSCPIPVSHLITILHSQDIIRMTSFWLV